MLNVTEQIPLLNIYREKITEYIKLSIFMLISEIVSLKLKHVHALTFLFVHKTLLSLQGIWHYISGC